MSQQSCGTSAITGGELVRGKNPAESARSVCSTSVLCHSTKQSAIANKENVALNPENLTPRIHAFKNPNILISKFCANLTTYYRIAQYRFAPAQFVTRSAAWSVPLKLRTSSKNEITPQKVFFTRIWHLRKSVIASLSKHSHYHVSNATPPPVTTSRTCFNTTLNKCSKVRRKQLLPRRSQSCSD